MRVGVLMAAAAMLTPAATSPVPDPHLDLEQVDAPSSLQLVEAWNARSLAKLEAQPGFATYRARAEAMLSTDRKIAEPDEIVGGTVLNLWQDAAHPRGLWRASPLAAFASGKPRWRTLIDVGALGRAEGRKWVFKGAACLSPDYVRCMVMLSDGGGDAVVAREFDLGAGRFVPGGFALPVAKSDISWAAPDALYVGTDFGPGSMTTSGYPRIAKLWQRGTPLASAKTIAEGEPADVRESVRVLVDGDTRWPLAIRSIDFYHDRASHIAPGGRLVASPLPDDARIEDVLDGRLIALLRSDWKGHGAGSLVAYSIADLLAGRTPAIETVFAPTGAQAVEQVAASRSMVWIKYLDDVSGRLASVTRGGDGRWTPRAVALPDKSTVHLPAVAATDDLAFATVEGMLTSPTLYAVRPGGVPAAIQALPRQFHASTMAVEQRFATSRDGTRVPYFYVHRKDLRGPVPAYIHAYGGFEAAQTPSYLVGEPYRSGPAALFWVEEGNAYVLADIRGGGEYGPAWHDAALREKRQNAYDDLYAVADDLVKAGITQKGRIAVSGRSNGGLLAGVAFTQRPDLFGAAVIGSPLLDMKRYSHLLAGASWMGEYGDPDKPADWAFIRRYSPYQNLRRGVRYPVPLIYTSTRDDRVHPGHARKFAARLEDYGDPFFYDEAIEGGHAAGVEPREDAQRAALVTAYLNLELPHDGPARRIGP